MAQKKSSAVKSKASRNSEKKVPAKVSAAEVDHLAQRTLNLWRDQMMTLAQSPKAMRDLSKVVEPVLNLFTQTLDMWLMMAEQAGKGMTQPWTTEAWAANPFMAPAKASSKSATAKNETQASSTTASTAARQGKAKAKPKKASSGAKAAAAVSGSGHATVAELAKRLANLKEHGKRVPGASASSRVAASAPNVTELATARQKRRRKA